MFVGFFWFVWALMVALCSLVLSLVAYYFLKKEKKLSKGMHKLKDIVMYYSIGLSFAIGFAAALLLLTF
ncbi:MAG: hypothetical protein V1900_02790 [Candidatus Aenigmatarchaeota archaeon]